MHSEQLGRLEQLAPLAPRSGRRSGTVTGAHALREIWVRAVASSTEVVAIALSQLARVARLGTASARVLLERTPAVLRAFINRHCIGAFASR